jgi:hypothetical protein
MAFIHGATEHSGRFFWDGEWGFSLGLVIDVRAVLLGLGLTPEIRI